MESITTDSIDISSLKRKFLAHSEPSQQGSVRSAQAALQRVLSQPQPNSKSHGRRGDNILAMQYSDSELPSTVPESLDAHAPLARPLPQEPDNEGAPRKMNEHRDEDATQEVSQEFYDGHIALSKSRMESTRGRRETQMTLNEGDEGHVDLVSSLVTYEAGPLAGQESEPVDVDFSPTQTQSRLPRFPESQRFKTPAPVGKKRDYNGNTKESPSLPRAPVLRSGGGTPSMVMGLSQAFADTQAATSPLIDGTDNVRSDRPSPNIDLNHRPATAPVSSPLKLIREIRRPSAEPFTKYVPYDESQEERNLRHWRELAEAEDSGNETDDSSWDEASKKRQRDRTHHNSNGERQARTSSPRSSPRRTRLPCSSAIISSPIAPATRSLPLPGADAYSRRARTTTPEPRVVNNEPAESEAETEQEDEEAVVQRSSQRPPVDPEDKENIDDAIRIPQTTARGSRMTNDLTPFAERSPSIRPHQEQPVSTGAIIPNTQISQGASQRPQPKSSTTSGPDFVSQSQDDNDQDDTSDFNQQVTRSFGPSNKKSSEQVQVVSEKRDTSDRDVSTRQAIEPADEPEDEPEDDIVDDDNADVKGLENGVHLELDPRSAISRHTAAPYLLGGSGRRSQRDTIAETGSGRSKSHMSVAANDTISELQTNFETAPTQMPPPVVKPPESSPPVTTPPPKRKRMSQISAEASPSQNGWSQNFNPLSALKDNDDMAALDDQSPIRPGKRRKLQPQKTGLDDFETTKNPIQIPPTSSESIIAGSDELLASQPAVRPKAGQRRLRRPTRGATESRDGERQSTWDVGVTPSPQKQAPVDKSTNRPVRKPTGRLARRNPPQSSIDDLVVEAPQDDTSEGSSEDAQPTQTQTPEKTPKKKQARSAEGNVQTTASTSEADSDTFRTAPADDVVAPNMVFACFNGKTRAYYPAWCLGPGNADQQYIVQWEGFDPDEVDVHGVRSLDLRIGDQVKVNLDGVPKISHVIRGYKDMVEGSELSQTMVDQRGFKTLLVAPKQRKSLPADVSTQNDREVPISSIYLDSNMWNQMKDRTFEYRPPPQSVDSTGYATPNELSTPSTPTSRHRRQIGVIATSTAVPHPSGMFKGMIFAISYEDADRRKYLETRIGGNGGLVVSDSFSDLFVEDQGPITLKPKYAASGFTALLADKHSRKPKYLQALALGLPCLSGQWVEACISKGEVINWQRYLLPAGECDELDGATRSRTLSSSNPVDVKLNEQLASRERILDSQKAIVIMGRNKAEMKMKNYVFFIRAMGVENLEKVPDTRAAKEVLDGDPDYGVVYVEKDVESVEAALKVTSSRRGKKKTPANGAVNWKVVETESIVQSLIFGERIDR
ncbi:uncharacterized protein HMPREF1541_10159 [Cyphellophora europaea CBS 101466]|uniref:BRCT domain-containing protein n=1 Tax=Cyphellophora europaea (strain CBS 101466) TaxID=1220924 RepID=W2S9B1_CYPE1|nr:uncharacterized protein HMPREF1541_10159 [Cyphellophora europaea CBS 101466]ETN44489.1 hypothetical protein HMPREF1541_10159 [Cyphellophora europaea CBS 101466]